MPSPWWYMAPSIVPLMQCSCPVPLAAKHPQSIMFPPLCFTLGMVFLGSKAAFHLLQKWRVELMPKSLNLVSSDHKTFIKFSSESFRCSLANFRRACTCAFLSRGTLRALEDCNCFLGDYGPSCLAITRSSCVVLGWFLTILMIIETPRGEILHGAPDRRRLTVILCFFHLKIIAPTAVSFSPSCLAMAL